MGIIISNHQGQLLWCRRINHNGWQFPQGGIEPSESPESALYRELYEEVGLQANQVKLLGRTQDWLRYKFPAAVLRKNKQGFIGQKQLWFLLQITDTDLSLEFNHTESPEFDEWQWVEYWYPVQHIVAFKKDVYKQALTELQKYL